MEDKKLYQCFLFVVYKSANITGRKKLRSYLLLPSSFIKHYPKECHLFTLNGIKLLTKQECPSLESSFKKERVDIIELVIHDSRRGVARSKMSALRLSVEKGHEDIVSQLFGKSVIISDSELSASDHVVKAIDRKNIELIENLPSIKTDVKFKGPQGSTFLHFSVSAYQEAHVNSLLAGGVNVNAARKDGSTALHLAAEQGNSSLVELLHQKGANIDLCRKDGATCLYLAVKLGHNDIAGYLIRNKAAVNVLKDGASPLLVAVKNQNVDIVTQLLDHGADVDVQSPDGKTILQLAVDAGIPKIVREILKHSNCLDGPKDKMALKKAILTNGEKADKIAKMLLDFGLTVDKSEVNDGKLFHTAVRKNYSQVIQQLIKFGFGVNTPFLDERKLIYSYKSVKHFEETYPIHTAVRYANGEITQMLIDAGADIELKRRGRVNEDVTVLEDAMKNGNAKAAVELLIANAARMENIHLILSAVAKGFALVVEKLMLLGAGLNAEAALVLASKSQDVQIVEILLKFGTSPNSADAFEKSALHHAAAVGCVSVVEILIKFNANLEKQDVYERTPLFDAVEKGHRKVVKVLLKNGAQLSMDEDARSVLHYCIALGNEKLFKDILDFFFTDTSLIEKTGILKIFWEKSLKTDLLLWKNYEDNKVNFCRYVKIFRQYIVKQKTAGKLNDVEDATLKWLAKIGDKKNFLQDCQEECARLKNLPIYGHILTKNKSLSSNKIYFSSSVRLGDYHKKFPIFAGPIHRHLQKLSHRRALFEKCHKKCHYLFEKFSKLPLEVLLIVFDYLSNRDLEIFYYACTETMV